MVENNKLETHRLTKKQHQLLREIDAVFNHLGLCPHEVVSAYAGDNNTITTWLTGILNHLLWLEIINQSSYVDMLLTVELSKHIIPESAKGQESIPLRTLRYTLRELRPMQKLRLIRSYRLVPKNIVTIIREVSDLRDISELQGATRLTRYRGSKLMSEGIERLVHDVGQVHEFFAPWFAQPEAVSHPRGSGDA